MPSRVTGGVGDLYRFEQTDVAATAAIDVGSLALLWCP